MQLRLTEEQDMLRDGLARLLGEVSTGDRVRAAEPLGFDDRVWRELVSFGVCGLRATAESGGSDLGLFEAVLAAEQIGRHVAPAPAIEAIVANGVLSRCRNAAAQSLASRGCKGAIVGFALVAADGDAVLVAGGAVAEAAVALVGDDLQILSAPSARSQAPNLANAPCASWRLTDVERVTIASGATAKKLHAQALEEWKLLTAAAIAGASERALELAAEYANQRIQFGKQIGSFQGISHPLADAISAVDGARLLVWDAVAGLSRGRAEAGALCSMAFAWAAKAASYATVRATHTFGGYGLALSSDVQLYLRRAKGWPLMAGDPQRDFQDVTRRAWLDERAHLPDADETQIDFEYAEETERFRKVVRKFFDDHLDDELRAHADMSWDGYHPRMQTMLAEANLLFPTWPTEYGGQNRDAYDFLVMREEYYNAGWTVIPVGVTRLVSEALFKYASDELKREVLPLVTKGDVVFCLGYTEPGSGSDVGAAQTRAVRDGDSWIIDGQKMFNSGANLAHYVFLLTRTGAEGSKHRGLTMFLVPMNLPGIEVFPFETLSDERSNSTYFTNVRVPDRYRVGEADDGWGVIRYALALEHTATYWQPHQEMIDRTVRWAKGNGRIADPDVQRRLGLAATRARISRLLMQRGSWQIIEEGDPGGVGPMSKLFSAEAFLIDSDDLVDLTAPDSVLSGTDGVIGLHSHFRHAVASINYGGTSEIMRSLVGQLRLRLPRDR